LLLYGGFSSSLDVDPLEDPGLDHCGEAPPDTRLSTGFLSSGVVVVSEAGGGLEGRAGLLEEVGEGAG
jgi:hypothetical protein